MIYTTQDIEKAARLLKEGKEVAYLITPQDKYRLFTFAYWQFKYRTLRSFRSIIYACEPDGLYYILKTVSIFSLGYYRIKLQNV